MRLSFMIIGFLSLAFGLNAYAVQHQNNSTYLIAPAVSWDGNRLSGELKNIPISRLLEDLIKSKHLDCTVEGKLHGTISISFNNLTPEEVIHKIMRSNNYNYTMMISPQPSTPGGIPRIGRLSIYQGDAVIIFNSIPKQVEQSTSLQRKSIDKRSPTPTPIKKFDQPKRRSKIDYQDQIKKLDGEIKVFLDDMLETKRMSQEEYNEAMSNLETKATIN